MSREAPSYYSYPTSIGVLTISCREGAVSRVSFGAREPAEGERRPSELSNRAVNQIHEYLSGKRKVFDIPMQARGTEFQRAVWRCIAAIPYGQTRSYADVAASIGRPTAFRAVGLACNANPLPLLVPCHRVVGSNGSLTGYAGGVELKRLLLALEQRSS
ncbi:methylated-DNA--[protein]-cysteine S-methyltransferase [Curtanaerobium respiraculi]|uniref:methylated-DNA--[protein]-cysteine S-methyltransferase n=1 Tax=Curtanaerobium respiraculi TaxID=2949669 RepID=UPI0024B3841F|nr:methylated-DNA--[protein]-cysteine S-methyltransferase [Curtanaerobium respiraculi]